jgi:hypothetical protein
MLKLWDEYVKTNGVILDYAIYKVNRDPERRRALWRLNKSATTALRS